MNTKNALRLLALVFVLVLSLGCVALATSASSDPVTSGSAVYDTPMNVYAGSVYVGETFYDTYQSTWSSGNVGTIADSIDMTTEGYAYYVDVEYYYDAQSAGILQIRFRNDYANSSAQRTPIICFVNGVLTVNYKGGTNFVEKGAAEAATCTYEFEEYGWHHVRAKLTQNSRVVDGAVVYGVSVDYLVDGVLWKSFDATESFVKTQHLYLYGAAVGEGGVLETMSVKALKALDASIPSLEGEELAAARATLSAYGFGVTDAAREKGKTDDNHLYVYGDDFHEENPTTERHSRIRLLAASWGSKPYNTVSPIKYDLGGGALVTEPPVVEPTSYVYNQNYVWTTLAGATYSFTEVDHFYVDDGAGKIVMPGAVEKLGQSFLGWYTDEACTTPYDASTAKTGAISLYAKWSELGEYSLTVDLLDGSTPAVCYPTDESFKLGDEAALWLTSDGKAYAAGETLTLTKNTTVYPISIELLDGASVRLDAAHSGLRFESRIPTALVEKLTEILGANGFVIGTLILPTDKLDGALTLETDGALNLSSAMANVKLAVGEDGYSTFYAAIVDIKGPNYTRAFSAVSYVKIGETVVYTPYSEKNNSRSVYGVAVDAYEGAYAENAIVKSYLDKVLVLDSFLRPVDGIEGYETPYEVSWASNVLSVTAKDGTLVSGDIGTIVIVGENTYTGGWTVVNNKLTAPYVLLYRSDFTGVSFESMSNSESKKTYTDSNLSIALGNTASYTYHDTTLSADPDGFLTLKNGKCQEYPQLLMGSGSVKTQAVFETATAFSYSMSLRLPEDVNSIRGCSFRLRGPDIAAADTRDGATKIKSNQNIVTFFKFVKDTNEVTLADGSVVATLTKDAWVDITITFDLKNNVVYGYCNGELVATQSNLSLNANYPYKDASTQTEYTLLEWMRLNSSSYVVEGSFASDNNTTNRGIHIDNLQFRVFKMN